MATINQIQIKRSATTIIPTGLEPGELAYSFAPSGNTLWIGDMNLIGSAIPIGGGNYYYLSNVTPGILTPNQVLVPNTSGYMNQIKVDQFIIDGVTIDNVNTFSNSTVLGLASNNELVTSFAIKNYVDLNTNVQLNFDTDVGSASVNPKTQMIDLAGGAGIQTTGINQTITFDLEDSGVIPGTYGSGISIPVVTVDTYGRVTDISTITTSSTLQIVGSDASVDTVSLFSDPLQFLGGPGVVSTVGLNKVTYTVDHDALPNFVATEHIDHATLDVIAGPGLKGGGTLTGDVTLSLNANTGGGLVANNSGLFVKTGLGVYFDASGNVAIGQEVSTSSNVIFKDGVFTGNLVVQGTQTIINTVTTTILDNLLRLASNNSISDIVDIGIYGEYNAGAGQVFTGLFRDASDGNYKLFENHPTEPGMIVTPPFDIATLVANITGGTVSGLLAPINVSDGGTGLTNIPINNVMIGNNTGPVTAVSGNPYEIFQISATGVPVFGIINCGDY